MFFGVVYRSEALLPETDVSNLDILRHALVENRKRGLTGFLHRDRGRFLQAIEGPRDAVEELVGKIEADHRHRSMVMLWKGELAHRRFGSWSMGYANPSPHEEQPDVLAMSPTQAIAFLQGIAERQAVAMRPRLVAVNPRVPNTSA